MQKGKGDTDALDQELSDVSRLVDEITRQMVDTTVSPTQKNTKKGSSSTEQKAASTRGASNGKASPAAPTEKAAQKADLMPERRIAVADLNHDPELVDVLHDHEEDTLTNIKSVQFYDNDGRVDRLLADVMAKLPPEGKVTADEQQLRDLANDVVVPDVTTALLDEAAAKDEGTQTTDVVASEIPVAQATTSETAVATSLEGTPAVAGNTNTFSRLYRWLFGHQPPVQEPPEGGQAITPADITADIDADEQATPLSLGTDSMIASIDPIDSVTLERSTMATPTLGTITPPVSQGAHDVSDLIACYELWAAPQYRFASFAHGLPMNVSPALFSALDDHRYETMRRVLAEIRSSAANMTALLHYGEAIMKEIQGDPVAALEHLTSLGRPIIDDPLISYDMARLAEEAGEINQAIECYGNIVNHTDNAIQRQFCLAHLARLAFEQEQKQEFLRYIQRLLSVASVTPEMVSRLGTLLLSLDDTLAVRLCLLLLPHPQGLDLEAVMQQSKQWLARVNDVALQCQLMEALKQVCGAEEKLALNALLMQQGMQLQDALTQLNALEDWVAFSHDATAKTTEAPYWMAVRWIVNGRSRIKRLAAGLEALDDGVAQMLRLSSLLGRLCELVGRHTPEYTAMLRLRLALCTSHASTEEQMQWLLDLYALEQGADALITRDNIKALLQKRASQLEFATRFAALGVVYVSTLRQQSAVQALPLLCERFALWQSQGEGDKVLLQQLQQQAEEIADQLDLYTLRQQNEALVERYIQLLSKEKRANIDNIINIFHSALARKNPTIMADLFKRALANVQEWHTLVTQAEQELPAAIKILRGNSSLQQEIYERLQDFALDQVTYLQLMQVLLDQAMIPDELELLLLRDLADVFVQRDDAVNLTRIRLRLWWRYVHLQQLDQAQKLLLSIVALDQEFDRQMGKSLVLPLELAAVQEFKKQKFDSAEHLLQRAYVLRQHLKILDDTAIIMLGNLAEVTLRLKHQDIDGLKQARELFRQGIKFAKMPQPPYREERAKEMLKAYKEKQRQVDTQIELLSIKKMR